MQLFYCPEINDGVHSLGIEESRHCIRVLRKKEGDEIDITDGRGKIFKVELTDLSPKKCQFNILSYQTIKKEPFSVHIAFTPTKNADRTEWFIEKAVEIGINKITFIQTSYSERNKVNMERLRKKAISAMKQSVRAYLPEITGVEKLNEICGSNVEDQKFIAHLDPASPGHLKDLAKKNSPYLILIGPEGGFSPEEIILAKSHGFLPVKLGEHRLRTETAGVVACSILNTLNQ